MYLLYGYSIFQNLYVNEIACAIRDDNPYIVNRLCPECVVVGLDVRWCGRESTGVGFS